MSPIIFQNSPFFSPKCDFLISAFFPSILLLSHFFLLHVEESFLLFQHSWTTFHFVFQQEIFPKGPRVRLSSLQHLTATYGWAECCKNSLLHGTLSMVMQHSALLHYRFLKKIPVSRSSSLKISVSGCLGFMILHLPRQFRSILPWHSNTAPSWWRTWIKLCFIDNME